MVAARLHHKGILSDDNTIHRVVRTHGFNGVYSIGGCKGVESGPGAPPATRWLDEWVDDLVKREAL
jgi:hypothetical protein